MYLLLEDLEWISSFILLHLQGLHPLYLPFELFCDVPVASPVWTATVPVLVVSFIGSTLFISCIVHWSAPCWCCIYDDVYLPSIQILTFSIIYGKKYFSLMTSLKNYKTPWRSSVVPLVSNLIVFFVYDPLSYLTSRIMYVPWKTTLFLNIFNKSVALQMLYFFQNRVSF